MLAWEKVMTLLSTLCSPEILGLISHLLYGSLIEICCVSAELSISMGKMGSAVLFIPPCGGGWGEILYPFMYVGGKTVVLCCMVVHLCLLLIVNLPSYFVLYQTYMQVIC